jgi:hypothetical protein
MATDLCDNQVLSRSCIESLRGLQSLRHNLHAILALGCRTAGRRLRWRQNVGAAHADIAGWAAVATRSEVRSGRRIDCRVCSLEQHTNGNASSAATTGAAARAISAVAGSARIAATNRSGGTTGFTDLTTSTLGAVSSVPRYEVATFCRDRRLESEDSDTRASCGAAQTAAASASATCTATTTRRNPTAAAATASTWIAGFARTSRLTNEARGSEIAERIGTSTAVTRAAI